MISRRRFIYCAATGLMVPAVRAAIPFPFGFFKSAAAAAAAGPPTSGLIAQWESASITGKNDGDQVTTWLDDSGNGRSATDTAGHPPLYKVNKFGSKPGVQYQSASATVLTFTPVTIPSFTVFLGWIVVGSSSFGGPLGWRAGGIAGFSYGNEDAGGGFIPHLTITDATNTVTQSLTNNGPGASSSPRLDVWKNDAGTVTARVNGVAKTVSAGGTTTPDLSPIASLGGNWFTNTFDGHFAAVLVYNTALSAGDITLVETYLNAKYTLF